MSSSGTSELADNSAQVNGTSYRKQENDVALFSVQCRPFLRGAACNRPGRLPVSIGMTETPAGQFDAFYRDTSRRLLRYAYGLTGDAAEAQDLVQEAYARAWQRWRRLTGYQDPEAWLRLVVNRLATDRWRRLGVQRLRAAADRPAEPSAEPSENTVLLVAAMRALPVTQRRALALYYLLDRSVAEIATETGVSTGTVKSWLSRGRAALAESLGDVVSPAPLTEGAPHAH
jgi:RNA polymerase sigma-70 factor (ECF subfamily)